MKFLSVKSILIFCIFLLASVNIDAQVYTPYSTWNHAGIGGVYLQPASIADTRLRFDMTVFGFDITAGNNLYGLKKGFVTSGDIEGNFNNYKVPSTNVKNHRALVGMDVQLLNFMVPLSPKSALGFTTRARTMINIDGVDKNMLDMMDNDLADFIGTSYSINNLAFRVNSWAEVGLTYAREILDLDEHYLKAGLTLKMIQPATSAYLYVDNADYSFKANPNDPDTEDIWLKARGKMAMPAGYSELDDFTDMGNAFDDFKFGKNMGFGFDFGMVYEYRPDHANYEQHGDGRSKWNRYEPSKYLFRIGLSILDVGSMKYNTDWTESFGMNTQQALPVDDIKNIDDLHRILGMTKQPTTYRMALPTAISLQTDWRINQIFYLGVSPYIALRQKGGDKIGTHYMTSINIAPRLEMAGLGVSMPITYNQFKAFNVGLGLRLGPLWVGSSNMFNILASNKLREINFCMGMRISIYHRNKHKSDSSSPVTAEGIN